MPKQGKTGKRPDNRPARKRYSSGQHLRKNKVKNLVRCCGMTREAAEHLWETTRTRSRGRKEKE